MSTAMNLAVVALVISGSFLLDNATARGIVLVLALLVGLIALLVFAPEYAAAIGLAVFGAFAMQKLMRE